MIILEGVMMNTERAKQIAKIEQIRAVIGDAAADAALAALEAVSPIVSMNVLAENQSHINNLTMINTGIYQESAQRTVNEIAQQSLQHYIQRLAGDCTTIPLGILDISDSITKGVQLSTVYIGLHVLDRDASISDIQQDDPHLSINAITAINQSRVTMLLGSPGAGKSTLVNYLCGQLAQAWLANDTNLLSNHLFSWNYGLRIPVRVILRDWAVLIRSIPITSDALADLWAYLEDLCMRWQCIEAVPLLWQMLHNGTAILCADGFDEVIGTDLSRVAHSLQTAITTFKTTPFVITCRILDYREEPLRHLQECAIRTLADLTNEQMIDFIEAWYVDYGKQRGMIPDMIADRQRSLVQAIKYRSALARLASSPLLLTIMAIIHASRGSLPETEALLYKECIEILLLRWRQANPEKVNLLDRLGLSAFGRKELFETMARLGYIAHNSIQGDQVLDAPTDLTKYQVLLSLTESLKPYVRSEEQCDYAATMIMYSVANGNGLLLQRGPQTYAFPHRTFQEFLAGYYIAGLSNKKPLVYNCANQIHWHNALRLMISYRVLESNDLDFPENLIRGLLERDSLSQILAGELLGIVGYERLQHYYGDLEEAKKLWKLGTATMLTLATNHKKPYTPPVQRVRAGVAHAMLVWGTTQLMLQDPIFHIYDQRLPLAYLNTPYQQESWWISALADYWCWSYRGNFWVGEDQTTLQQVRLDYDFAVGRYPVTNAEYARFIVAGGYTTQKWWTEQGWKFLQPGGHRWDDQAHYITMPRLWDNIRFTAPSQPVVGVSWYEAMAYCKWLSEQLGMQIRLPTSYEHERTSRHTDQRPYPWGDTHPTPDHANTQETLIGKLSPIGCFPLGNAINGASDLKGNIIEWLSTGYGSVSHTDALNDCHPENHVLLSDGTYLRSKELLHCGSRDWFCPIDWFSSIVGFRVCLIPDDGLVNSE